MGQSPGGETAGGYCSLGEGEAPEEWEAGKDFREGRELAPERGGVTEDDRSGLSNVQLEAIQMPLASTNPSAHPQPSREPLTSPPQRGGLWVCLFLFSEAVVIEEGAAFPAWISVARS